MPRLLFRETVERTLRGDLGSAGDLTTDSIVSSTAEAEGAIRARSAGCVAGLDVAALTFELLADSTRCRALVDDGATVEAGASILRVEGLARPILSAERTALNFLGHLSGVASATRALVDAVKGTGCRIASTRKTTPGLDALEKYAVRCGGGADHRFGLYDAILIKDNHIAVAGGVEAAVVGARARAGHLVRIELEVDTLEQLEVGLALGVEAFLLDNMTLAQLRQAVALNSGRATLEASGGITFETVRGVASTGVDVISVGWLTHSAPSLDVGLDLEV